MKTTHLYIAIALLCLSQISRAQTKKEVSTFDTVIISPHIETIFTAGTDEAVTIESCTVPEDKLNIIVKNNTLRVYLDDAKETTKTEVVYIDGVKRKVPIYKGKVATITISYKQLVEVSLRGEESTDFKSKIDTNSFDLKIYGESNVNFDEVQFQRLTANVYGESRLTIKEGSIEDQKIVAYGEGEIDLSEIANKTSKIRAYGEAEFKVNVSEEIKFTAYGEARLYHSGAASVNTGITIGDVEIIRVD